MIERADVTGVLLAGGRGRRMGGADKGWLTLDGEPLVKRAIARLAPQVGRIVVSANRHLEDYRRLGHPVIADTLSGFPGPLAGAYSAMQAVSTPWTLLVPVDMPWLPTETRQRLADALDRHSGRKHGGIPQDIVVAHDGDRLQPLVALLRTSLQQDLGEWLGQGDGKVIRWYERHRWCRIDFSDVADRFANLNTPQEHVWAESRDSCLREPHDMPPDAD